MINRRTIKMKKLILSIVVIPTLLVACNNSDVPLIVATPSFTETPQSPQHITEPTVTQIFETISVPTMLSAESEMYTDEFLETNGGCSLPCVWSIVPSKTNYSDALLFFEHLGWTGGESFGYYSTGKDFNDFRLAIRINIYSSKRDVVDKIHVGIGGIGYTEKVKYFSIDNVIKTLGRPTEVYVFIGVSPGIHEPDQTSFEILLYYENKNMLVEYTGTAVKVATKYRVCPAYPNAESEAVDTHSGNVSLYVGTENQIYTLQELVQPFWSLPDYYISVDKAFGLNADQYSKKISQGGKDTCFESPLSAWSR